MSLSWERVEKREGEWKLNRGNKTLRRKGSLQMIKGMIRELRGKLEGLIWWSSGEESPSKRGESPSIPSRGTKTPHFMGQPARCAATREKPVSTRCSEDPVQPKLKKKRGKLTLFYLENSYLSFKAQFTYSLSVKSSWALDHSLTLWVSCPDALAPTACCMSMCAEFVCARLCLTLCNPMDSSQPGPSVGGIFQAGILEWVAISFSRGSSWPRDWNLISCTSFIGSHILYQCNSWYSSFLAPVMICCDFLLLLWLLPQTVNEHPDSKTALAASFAPSVGPGG